MQRLYYQAKESLLESLPKCVAAKSNFLKLYLSLNSQFQTKGAKINSWKKKEKK